MTVSSQTPAGFPSHCPLCGAATPIAYSDTGDDAPCPSCGCFLGSSAILLERLQNRLADLFGMSPADITPEMKLTALGADSSDIARLIVELLEMDSLDTVDFVMELEEDDGLPGQIETVADLARYLQTRQAG